MLLLGINKDHLRSPCFKLTIGNIGPPYFRTETMTSEPYVSHPYLRGSIP